MGAGRIVTHGQLCGWMAAPQPEATRTAAGTAATDSLAFFVGSQEDGARRMGPHCDAGRGREAAYQIRRRPRRVVRVQRAVGAHVPQLDHAICVAGSDGVSSIVNADVGAGVEVSIKGLVCATRERVSFRVV